MIRAANVTWTRYRGFWSACGVPLRLRIQVFRSVFLSTLLAGLEATVLTKALLKRLEICAMKKLRFFLHGEAYGWTNSAVRERLLVNSIESMLRVRRL